MRAKRAGKNCKTTMASAFVFLLISALVCSVSTGCDTPSFGSHVSSHQIVELGAEAAVQFDSQYQTALPTDPGMTAFQSVAPVLQMHATGLPSYVTLHIVAIESDEEIAISLPDGHIYVSSGLLAKIGNDPDEVACVLSHEIGHVALGHDVENLTAALGDSTVADMLSQGEYQDIVNTEIELSRLSYSKDQEVAADRYAVQLAHSSGYDASALVRFLSMVGSEQQSQSEVQWDASHPLFKQRVPDVEDDIRRLSR